MDFGGIILGLLCLFVGVPLIVLSLIEVVRKGKFREAAIFVLILGPIFCVLIWYGDYKAYYLDEGLYSASCEGDFGEVKRFVRLGADPNCGIDCQDSALAADDAGHPEIADYLRQHGDLSERGDKRH